MNNLYGKFHPAIAQSLNNIGFIYLTMGYYEKAKKFIEDAYQIRRKIFGECHPDIATSLNNLGNVFSYI
jgi:tetratricopeptide (TPR) repeat protein